MMEHIPIGKEPKQNTSTPEDNKQVSLFKIRTLNECIMEAKNKPIPKMLFSQFWYEGELCILFADTNLGKSILSVQIANSISSGIPIHGFKMEAEIQPVVYIDFELTDKQFEKRYSNNYTNHFIFSENLIRLTIDPLFSDFDNFEKQLFSNLEQSIIATSAKVVIVDNITYLKEQATDTAKEALPLMKKLNDLKMKYDLSILALAHTPKRNSANPITNNDITGSKHIANFADSIFAIGESFTERNIRYLKQVKARATEIIYDTYNIIVCEVVKHNNFLAFEFIDFGTEKEHLKIYVGDDKEELDQAIVELKTSELGLSDREIAKRLNTNAMKVGRVLKRNNV